MIMATTTIIPIHAGKGTVAAALKMSVDYMKNPNKTEGGQWVTSYECDPLIADAEFLFSKNQYAAITGRDQGKRDIIAFHLRVSFLPGETDAETANRIGYELAKKLTHGNHAFVCCTHTDRDHIHTHIAINSTSLDCTRKFRNFKGSSFAIRRIADQLCLENGLSIIEKPKPSRGSYGKWLGDRKPPTLRDKLRDIIDANIVVGRSYGEFLASLKAAGCDVKPGKRTSARTPGSQRYIRFDSLGDGYTEDAIKELLMGTRDIAPRRKSGGSFAQKPSDDSKRDNTNYTADYAAATNSHNAPSLLVDIQAKLAEGKGGGYRQWATVYNLKESAKTLIYLKENGIDDYEELKKKSMSASGAFAATTKRIRDIESRQKDIAELQKQIGTYGKTREIYAKYKASGWSRDFYDVHATDIILHKAAKKHFDALGMKKLPSINQLKQEYATLASERKTLYGDYHRLKDTSRELSIACANAERILGITPDTQNREAQRDRSRYESR